MKSPVLLCDEHAPGTVLDTGDVAMNMSESLSPGELGIISVCHLSPG